MNSSLTSYAEHANGSLTATNSAELKDGVLQLAGGKGGTITMDSNGGPYTLALELSARPWTTCDRVHFPSGHKAPGVASRKGAHPKGK